MGVRTWPKNYHHLTYGTVMNVLQGLWWYCVRAGNSQTAIFEVKDDRFGTVGMGMLVRPPDSRAVAVEES